MLTSRASASTASGCANLANLRHRSRNALHTYSAWNSEPPGFSDGTAEQADRPSIHQERVS